jgi:trehalose-phosphatase
LWFQQIESELEFLIYQNDEVENKSWGLLLMGQDQVHSKIITRTAYDAVIFDLDGVVTRTAELHSVAWKTLFNTYLMEREARQGETYSRFDENADYRRYVDGKPRYDGVKSFLESRGIQIPYGNPSDAPGIETICGLGNRKNRLFHDLLKRIGVKVYSSTIRLIHDLHTQNIKTAIVSSSKNCTDVLKATGITDLFHVQVDGTDSERLDLNGKPAPDIFLQASEWLNVPANRCVVIEDSLAGVRAGSSGDFALVIGVDRENYTEEFRRNGADWIVNDLSEVSVGKNNPVALRQTRELPSALDCREHIRQQAAGRKWGVFLDYDGTLTPIVEHPEDAILSRSMRHTLKDLSQKCPVAVISGRELKDIRKRVNIEDIIYAGSHGFDISGPGFTYRQGLEFLPALDGAEQDLEEALNGIQGVRIERKTFSIAVHFRQVPEEAVESVEKAVDGVIENFPSLRKAGGKKIFECRPNIDWHKGKALILILEKSELERSKILPMYIGDDLTDEDAFEVLAQDGVGIVVRDESRPTRARYALNNPAEVEQFLNFLVLIH